MDYPILGKAPDVGQAVVAHYVNGDGNAVPGSASDAKLDLVNEILGGLGDDPVTDPNALVASLASLFRGFLELASDPNPTPVIQSGTPTPITTKTTTIIRTSAGKLHRIVINKGGSADTLTIYDAATATGTPIATITAPTVGMVFDYGADLAIGLTIVSGGTTAGDYTVISSAS